MNGRQRRARWSGAVGASLLGLGLFSASSPSAAEPPAARSAAPSRTATASSTVAPTRATLRGGYVPRYAFRRSGRWIESGLRVENDHGGILVSNRSFGDGGEAEGLPIPEHLGGGYFFLQPVAALGQSSTALYRSPTWTGVLKPLGSLPYVVRDVRFGFDRVYLLGTGHQVGFDLDSGQLLSLDPLPPHVTLFDVRFWGSERAVVEVPLSGVLYSEDVGRTWWPLPDAKSLEDADDGPGLFVWSNRGTREVLPGGSLSETVTRGSRSEGERRRRDEEELRSWTTTAGWESADASGRALMTIVEQGTAFAGGALSITEGQALVLDSRQGVRVRFEPVASAEGLSCRGTRTKTGKELPVFACEDTLGRVGVHALQTDEEAWRRGERPGLRLKVLLPQGQRRLVLVDEGGIVVSGSCRTSKKQGYCVVRRSQKTSHAFAPFEAGSDALALDGNELLRLHNDRERERISVERSTGESIQRRTYSWSPERSERQMLEGGSVLPGASFVDDEVAFWVTHRERFVGMRLGDAKYPAAGAIQRPLSRATFAGRYAFLWGAAGFAKLSVDGGLHFTETLVPFKSGDPHLATVLAVRGAVRIGCSEVGCSLGRFIRLGWDVEHGRAEETPPMLSLPDPGGGKWHFACGTEGEGSGPRLAEGDDDFPSFWERSAPAARHSDDKFSVDFQSALARLYVTGPSEVSWGRQGSAQLLFVDPFDPKKVQWTSPTPRLFASSLDAQEELGLLERHTTHNEIAMDPSGDRGLLLVRTRQSVNLYSFQNGAPLVRYPGEEGSIWRGMTSAVVSAQTWYAGFVIGRSFMVARLSQEGVQTIAELPLGDASSRGAQLVRTRAGDLGVSMEGDAGLLVYPLSTEGALGDPILVPHQDRRAPTCSAGVPGFIVDRDLSLTPYFATERSGPLEVNDLRARMIVGHAEPCIEAMSARTRSVVHAEPPPTGTNVVPLSLLNHDSTRGRNVLLCK